MHVFRRIAEEEAARRQRGRESDEEESDHGNTVSARSPSSRNWDKNGAKYEGTGKKYARGKWGVLEGMNRADYRRGKWRRANS
jgi:hypothetical protein